MRCASKLTNDSAASSAATSVVGSGCVATAALAVAGFPAAGAAAATLGTSASGKSSDTVDVALGSTALVIFSSSGERAISDVAARGGNGTSFGPPTSGLYACGGRLPR